MAAGDSITAVDSVSAGTTTIQPSSGDVWKIAGARGNTNTSLESYDGTNTGPVLAGTSGKIPLNYFADNNEYAQWNNSGCSAETAYYSGQKVVE